MRKNNKTSIEDEYKDAVETWKAISEFYRLVMYKLDDKDAETIYKIMDKYSYDYEPPKSKHK